MLSHLEKKGVMVFDAVTSDWPTYDASHWKEEREKKVKLLLQKKEKLVTMPPKAFFCDWTPLKITHLASGPTDLLYTNTV